MGSKRPLSEETCFLNVDLDIEASYDLAPLVEALAPDVSDLHTGPLEDRYQTHLELGGPGSAEPASADWTIRGFLTLLSRLSPQARALWEGATRRDFNIGIQGGTKPHAFELALESATLREASQLGARVVVTVYAVDRSKRRRPA